MFDMKNEKSKTLHIKHLEGQNGITPTPKL